MKKLLIGISLTVFCIIILFLVPNSNQVKFKKHASSSSSNKIAAASESEIDEFINEKINKGKLPGLSVVIVQNDKTIYEKSFGYADIESRKMVTSDTFFELGSNSKAFTALAVLKLEQEGFINLNDSITKYIPWLHMNYEGKETAVTIEELLHHTSGIPSYTISRIPIAGDEDRNAIENTVRKLIDIELAYKPGSKHSYATINYDVLGILIEKVSGRKYEDYMECNILKPVGLNNTYMYKSKLPSENISKGYKLGFLTPKYYNAPSYNGNKPAGYIISNAKDMASWMKIQFSNDKLIEASHIPNKNLKASKNEPRYAAGWYIFNGDGSEISHSGSNPNYSSHIVLNPKDKLGVAVLCNMNSFYASTIGNDIMSMLKGKPLDKDIGDLNTSIDIVSTKIIIITAIICIITMFFLIKIIKQIHLKERILKLYNKKAIIRVIISLLSAFALSYAIYSVPYFLLRKRTWQYIFVWYPSTVRIALYLIYADIWLIWLWFICHHSTNYKNN